MSVYAKPVHAAYSSPLRLERFRTQMARLASDRSAMLGLILLAALLAFELFNFSTTEFALSDSLGGLQLGNVRWATILALAFSAMDFAGIAWLFTPGHPRGLQAWYLMAAWFLAAAMNAILTWWAVSLALVGHEPLGDLIIGQQAMLRGVPVFVALLVWLLRILLIGSFTLQASGSRRSRSRTPTPVAARRTPVRLVRHQPEVAARGTARAPRAHPR